MPRWNGFLVRLATVLISIMMTSCSSPNSSLGTETSSPETPVTNTLGPQGQFGYTPDEPLTTRIIPGDQQCEGTVVTPIHPLVGDQCVLNAMLLPITSLINAANVLTGEQDNTGIYHTDLPGAQNYYVAQLYQNDCWAAAFEMTRKYLKLYPVSQDELVAHAHNVCPAVSTQKGGATLYQIFYTTRDELSQYDAPVTKPHFCDESKCIVFALLSGNPVIILMPHHALVMVGADWEKLSDTNVLILRVRVLDPNPTIGNKIETLSSIKLCDAEAFIAY
jgi:hypothetical protein